MMLAMTLRVGQILTSSVVATSTWKVVPIIIPATEDKVVFECVNVFAEDFNDGQGPVVIVYCSKFNADTRTWDEVDNQDPIQVADVVNNHTNKKNIITTDKILTYSHSRNSKIMK
jgi:hypothetical protein